MGIWMCYLKDIALEESKQEKSCFGDLRMLITKAGKEEE